MIFLDKTLNFFANRVKKFGAPYLVFAIFGSINYPAAYFFRIYIQNLPETESFFFKRHCHASMFWVAFEKLLAEKNKKIFTFVLVCNNHYVITSYNDLFIIKK